MFFLKVSLVFCGVALLLAIAADLALFLGARFAGGGVGLLATQRGWIIRFAIWWAVPFLIALLVSKILRVFPLYLPK